MMENDGIKVSYFRCLSKGHLSWFLSFDYADFTVPKKELFKICIVCRTKLGIHLINEKL